MVKCLQLVRECWSCLLSLCTRASPRNLSFLVKVLLLRLFFFFYLGVMAFSSPGWLRTGDSLPASALLSINILNLPGFQIILLRSQSLSAFPFLQQKGLYFWLVLAFFLSFIGHLQINTSPSISLEFPHIHTHLPDVGFTLTWSPACSFFRFLVPFIHCCLLQTQRQLYLELDSFCSTGHAKIFTYCLLPCPRPMGRG